MKTEKLIIYDDNCPLCSAYTRAFVKTDIIKQENRIAFSSFSLVAFPGKLDIQKAKHQIPVIDAAGGETLYGVDGLTFLLSRKIPFIKSIMNLQPVYSFFSWLYNVISYNRRIIIPSTNKKGFDCCPDYNLKYRLTYITICILLASGITFLFGANLFTGDVIKGGRLAVLICGSGWLIHILISSLFIKEKVTYLGHLSTIMLLGALLLVPFIIVSIFTEVYWLALISMMASFTIMLWQHVIRAIHLGMSFMIPLIWAFSLIGGVILAGRFYALS